MGSDYIVEEFNTPTEARRRYLELSRQGKYPTRDTIGGKVKKYIVRYRGYVPLPTANIQDDIIRNLGAVGARDSLAKNLDERFK